MWDLPGPGLEPASPALAGGFLTTERPGKSHLGSKAAGGGEQLRGGRDPWRKMPLFGS